MQRREFLAMGLCSPAAVSLTVSGVDASERDTLPEGLADAFPRAAREVYLNAAAGAPLNAFAEHGLRRYLDFARLGPDGGRGEYFREATSGARALFAQLIHAETEEIALVNNTKTGEQIVIDGLSGRMVAGANIVTNDFHFAGSLHNYVGLKRAGWDVRIVRNQNWDITLEEMAQWIDERTALVSVTLISNVNGRRELIRELAALAHARGALLYADIIQAAGISPIDVHDMGIDCAACSCYKWLLGIHGCGFLYVRREVQGAALPDRLYPGHAVHQYAPWAGEAPPDAEHFSFNAPSSARRYEPGHVCYMGYCAQYESLRQILDYGVEQLERHSVHLCAAIRDALDGRRDLRCITPEIETPILSYYMDDPDSIGARLADNGITVAFRPPLLRISPAIYNTEDDAARLIRALR